MRADARLRSGPRRARTVAGATLAALAASVVLGAAPAPAAIVERQAEQRGTRAYWTPERLRSAVPRRLAIGGRADVGAAGARSGSPTAVAPVEPGPPAVATPAVGPVGGLGASYTREEVPDPGREPYRAHGRVFFSVVAGSLPGDYSCSGTALASANDSVVWTAGHCVFDRESGGGFARNWIFIPAYRDGVAPFGKWVAERLAAPRAWTESGSPKRDLGAAVVGEDPGGRALTELVGGRGIGFNQPREQFYESFGYPAQPPFDGEREFRCSSPFAGTDDPGGPGPDASAIGCDMTGGASGGGWVAGGSVLSVNSYMYCDADGCEERIYGPYQDGTAEALYRSLAGGTVTCAGRKVTHRGTDGADVLLGTAGRDVFKAGRGDDEIRGRRGADYVCAGGGGDLARGGRGRDRLYGQRENDALIGGRGRRDRCDGGAGVDTAGGCERALRVP